MSTSGVLSPLELEDEGMWPFVKAPGLMGAAENGSGWGTALVGHMALTGGCMVTRRCGVSALVVRVYLGGSVLPLWGGGAGISCWDLGVGIEAFG